MLGSVKVNKADLMKRVTENRAQHRATFEAAIDGWHKQAIQVLADRLADAKAGKRVNLAIHLPMPEDHTPEYDQVLEMLAFEIDDEITLDARSFAEFVRDDWGWKQQFTHTAATYMVE